MTLGGSRQEETGQLLAKLRAGDREAFRRLFKMHHASMLNFARTFLKDRGSAEEAVQDAWVAIIAGVAGFEGRSSLKSWMFAIVANKARTKAVRDGRMVPFSYFSTPDEPVIEADRFTPEGSWGDPPGQWTDITPERIIAGRELLVHVQTILAKLPESQRTVVSLRDVEGLDASEVCDILAISEGNQRILLHRGRARIRQAIEELVSDSHSGTRPAAT